MRELPLVYDVDVVVVGGSLAGVSAATAAAKSEASVLLVESRTYLGEDLCATLNLSLAEGEEPSGSLTHRIFADGRPATPLRVKKSLDKALVDSGARFLLGCFVTDVLKVNEGHLAGVVLANRAGRQAVRAKVIVDATPLAWVARQAGVEFRPLAAKTVECRRVTMAKDVTEHRLDLEIPSANFAALMKAEHEARDATHMDGVALAAERISFVPQDSIVGRGKQRGLTKLDIATFQPRDAERLLVIGACADVSREEATKLLRPSTSERVGRFIGGEAARLASSISISGEARLPGDVIDATERGEVLESLAGLRAVDDVKQTVTSKRRRLPVLGRYDVVVIGGGTSGAPAAISAARGGARTLVVEFQAGLGGVGTLGMIGKPYKGKRVGFGKEVPFPSKTFTIEDKLEWFRRQIRDAGGDIWFGAIGCGAVVEGSRVIGAVVATPQGRGVVLADVVIDATGAGDIAVAAGADSMFGEGGRDIAMQGTGLPTRELGAYYTNSDYLLVDESDMLDTWRALVGARMTMSDKAYDAGVLIQTRERRRVVGDHVLAYLDQIVGRTYPDSIVWSASDYDSHGYPSNDYFALLPHDKQSRKKNHPAPGGTCFTPYRCLLPRGLDGILVIGLGISMERDASAMVRMQPDMHNQGYAAGVAAAMAVRGKTFPRDIDVKALQRRLVKLGSLPKQALTDDDSYPLDDVEIRDAIQQYGSAINPSEAGRPLAVILSHRDAALPYLSDAFEAAETKQRLAYAKLLGCLGERRATPALVEALDAIDKWDGRILQGRMAEYAHLPTPIDSLIIALGNTGAARAVPPILRKLETLDADVTLSHHRSIALALERLASPTAAKPLARLLSKPGMSGHAMTQLEPLHNKEMELRRRLAPLREITLARALYRCGDHEGLGESILSSYRNDLRGLFARHADEVLGE